MPHLGGEHVRARGPLHPRAPAGGLAVYSDGPPGLLLLPVLAGGAGVEGRRAPLFHGGGQAVGVAAASAAAVVAGRSEERVLPGMRHPCRCEGASCCRQSSRDDDPCGRCDARATGRPRSPGNPALGAASAAGPVSAAAATAARGAAGAPRRCPCRRRLLRPPGGRRLRGNRRHLLLSVLQLPHARLPRRAVHFKLHEEEQELL